MLRRIAWGNVELIAEKSTATEIRSDLARTLRRIFSHLDVTVENLEFDFEYTVHKACFRNRAKKRFKPPIAIPSIFVREVNGQLVICGMLKNEELADLIRSVNLRIGELKPPTERNEDLIVEVRAIRNDFEKFIESTAHNFALIADPVGSRFEESLTFDLDLPSKIFPDFSFIPRER